MPLPRLHPLTKTYTDLRRCEERLEEFISRFPEDKLNEADQYSELLETIKKAKSLVPSNYE
jgi:hypothetical protein